MFVPCDSFIYHPYTSIFTRILGNDNIFKGLSTFNVEMSEVCTFLNNADKNLIKFLIDFYQMFKLTDSLYGQL